MSDIEVGGYEVTFDLSKMTIKEYRSTYDPAQPEGDADEIMARCADGITLEELQSLSYPDWRLFGRAFFKKAQEPLADPN